MDITPQLDAVLRCLSRGGLPDEEALHAATAALDTAAVPALPRAHKLSAQQCSRLHRRAACATFMRPQHAVHKTRALQVPRQAASLP